MNLWQLANYDYLIRQRFGIRYWKLYKDSENAIVFENIALYIYVYREEKCDERAVDIFLEKNTNVCQNSLETIFELKIS